MLGYRKVSARWVPKMLSDEHKEQRVTVFQTLLDLVTIAIYSPNILHFSKLKSLSDSVLIFRVDTYHLL